MFEHREPPKWADRLLEFFVKGDLLEEIQGDLFEYYQRLGDLPQWRSKWIYAYHVIHFLRPFALKKLSQNSNNLIMLKFNLMIAWRNLLKHKFYSAINIMGLAIGLASAIYIALYVYDELSYDAHFENSERIVRVASELALGDNYWHMVVSPDPLAAAFKSEFPEIEKSARFRNTASLLVKKNAEVVKLNDVMFTDQEMLEIFKFDVVYGDLKEALSDPTSAVLTLSSARKLFGDRNPVGQSFVTLENNAYQISAVVKELPDQTHFHFDVLISMVGNPRANKGIWLSNNFHTYMLLKEGVLKESLEAKFPSVYEKYFGPQLQEYAGISYEQALSNGGLIRYHLQPIEDIHLKSHLDIELEPNSRIEYVYLFTAIGIFLVIIASINFINISTARASTRAKEIGVKKVMGSVRGDLIAQFLTESVFQALIAAVLAMIIVAVFLPFFNAFVDKELIDPIFGEQSLWWKVVFAAFGIGLLAGIYPSLYLSAFKPVDIMKGKTSKTGRKSMFRNVLVVFQFGTSLVLIIGTLTVYNQLNHIKNQDLGYNRDQVILIENSHSLGSSVEGFKESLLSIPEVDAVTNTGNVPSGSSSSDSTFEPVGAGNVDDPVSLQIWSADPSYFNTFGMEIIDGRAFEYGRPADSSAIILNETAALKMGLEEPVGKKVRVFGDFVVAGRWEFTVIGIVKDFNYKSLHQEVGPMGLYLQPNAGYYTAVKTKSADYPHLINRIEASWDKFAPSMGFSYQFLDTIFDEQYKAEERLGEIFLVFASLAMFIGCLGLFGLSAYTAEQRRKEIGVRKVLGASTSGLILLLLGDFTKLLIIAIIMAIPVSWFAMNSWLEDFAYRVSLGPGIFLLGSLVAMIVAWLTVSYQSTIAARANPSENLKYE